MIVKKATRRPVSDKVDGEKGKGKSLGCWWLTDDSGGGHCSV
jgi:hypothetical protein